MSTNGQLTAVKEWIGKMYAKCDQALAGIEQAKSGAEALIKARRQPRTHRATNPRRRRFPAAPPTTRRESPNAARVGLVGGMAKPARSFPTERCASARRRTSAS